MYSGSVMRNAHVIRQKLPERDHWCALLEHSSLGRDNSTPPILKASTHKALSLTNTLHRFQSVNSFLCLCFRANTLPNNSLIAMAAPVPNSMVRNVADFPELESSQLPTQGGQDSQVTVASGSPPDKTPSVEVDVPTNKTSGGTQAKSAQRMLVRKRLREAQQALAGVYRAQGRQLPAELLPSAQGPKRTKPSSSQSRASLRVPYAFQTPANSRTPRAAGSPQSTMPSGIRGYPVKHHPRLAGRTPSSSVARGLTFTSPRTSSRRTYRPVSPDLPFSLLAADPAGLITAGYTDLGEAVEHVMTHAELVAQKDDRAHDYSPRLRRAGLLSQEISPSTSVRQPPFPPVRSVFTEEPAPESAPASDPVLDSGEVSDEALDHSDEGSEDDSLPEQGVTLESQRTVGLSDRRKLDKAIAEGIPSKVDLDDSGAVVHALMRFEAVCLRNRAVLDNHTALLESVIDQPNMATHQEKTRLLAMTNYASTHRDALGNLAYGGFRNLLLKVAGGELPRYSRKSLSALSQKASGSFDRYLSDFETQCAYVLPSFSEKLELFMGGLNPGFRNRVLARPDGTDWTSWSEFLTVCRRFVVAESRAKELPSIHGKAAATIEGRKRFTEENTTASGQRQRKRSKKLNAAAPSAAAQQRAPAERERALQTNARRAVIGSFCERQKLCPNCLESVSHSQGRTPSANGKRGRCTRDRVPAVSKWGKVFSDAVAAKVAELRSSS